MPGTKTIRRRTSPSSCFAMLSIGKGRRIRKKGYPASGGMRFQIKGRRLHPSNTSRQLSAIRDLDGFDTLAGVLSDKHYRVARAALIPCMGAERVRPAHEQQQVHADRRHMGGRTGDGRDHEAARCRGGESMFAGFGGNGCLSHLRVRRSRGRVPAGPPVEAVPVGRLDMPPASTLRLPLLAVEEEAEGAFAPPRRRRTATAGRLRRAAVSRPRMVRNGDHRSPKGVNHFPANRRERDSVGPSTAPRFEVAGRQGTAGTRRPIVPA